MAASTVSQWDRHCQKAAGAVTVACIVGSTAWLGPPPSQHGQGSPSSSQGRAADSARVEAVAASSRPPGDRGQAGELVVQEVGVGGGGHQHLPPDLAHGGVIAGRHEHELRLELRGQGRKTEWKMAR